VGPGSIAPTFLDRSDSVPSESLDRNRRARWKRTLCERLEERDRFRSQQRAVVRLADPFNNPDDRAIARGHGQEI
jgi:hypothetical protein